MAKGAAEPYRIRMTRICSDGEPTWRGKRYYDKEKELYLKVDLF